MAKVLVIGSGGREHALCHKFSKSKQVDQVFVAPGNDGMKDVATVVAIGVDQLEQLKDFVVEHQIDLTFVGPEIPLVLGIVDFFQAHGLLVFGPSKQAAQLEGSKSFAKDFMKKYHIPTASYAVFTKYPEAMAYLSHQTFPIVIKADGLAAGKGVVIPMTLEEAQVSLYDMMCDHKFADAGVQVVVESYLEGEEFSLLAFVCGERVYPMPIAQDHKRAFDFDQGLNTGGMGAYTPVSHIPSSAVQEALREVMLPVAKGMVEEGMPFTGILYGGFMLTKDGVKTIEFNVRFGDPECEVILPALQSDLYEIVMDILHGKEPNISFDDKYYLGVVLASVGYPETHQTGAVITGLEDVNCSKTRVYHMGTKEINKQWTTSGGRVLVVVSEGNTLAEAQATVYREIGNIKSAGLFYRSDIGHHASQSIK